MKKYILVFTMLASSLFSQNYYISSTTGNDNNNGKSESRPFKTIAKLNTINFRAGDNIFFKSGDIWVGETFTLKNSGTQYNKITITTYGTGKKPIITLREEITQKWTAHSSYKNVWFIKTPFNLIKLYFAYR